ncbi:MAG: efflux RND transporter periplasmic adaptor subunit [Saprospiraceae bacterium]
MKPHFLLWLSATLVLAGCGEQQTEDATADTTTIEDAYLVRIDTVRAAEAAGMVQLTGMVSSDKEGKPAFKTGGVVAQVLVSEGDKVKAGQTVARLNMQEIDAQVAQAELGLQKARRDWERVQNLYADSVATREQYLNAQTAWELAARQVEVANFNRTWSEAKAPIGGTVFKVLVQPGEIAGPGQPLMLIQGTQADNWVVLCGVTDEQWAALPTGMRATVALDAYPGKTWEAWLSDKGSMANGGGGTFPLEFSFRESPPNLAAGLIARITVSQAYQAGTLRIPLTAMAEADGRSAIVYVPGKDNQVEARVVRIGQLHEHWVEVTAGLSPGEVVVATGASWLRDGDRIMVANR